MVTGLGYAEPGYTVRWVRWFLGDALTHLLITPFIVLWASWKITNVQSRPIRFYLELIALTATLFVVSLTAFSGRMLSVETFPAILYLPLPILLWAAVRFGPRGIFSCSVFVAVVCIWSGSRGYGPFIEHSAARNVINMQIFLSITLTPLLFLAALVKDHRRSEDQLRESEQRFRDLTESTSDWVWEVDKEGLYTYSSPKIYELLGYHPEEVIGKKPFDLMPPDEAKRVSDFFSNIAVSNKSFEFLENINIHKNGDLVTMETSGVPFFDDKATLLGFRGIDRDVTARKEAEAALQENEKRLRDLYENAPNPYFSVGVDGRILRCNRRAKELLGYEDDALIGKMVLDLYEDNQYGREEAMRVLKRFQAGEDIRDEELLMQKADGTPFWISLSVNAIKNAQGQVVESRSMVVDITERKSAEQALADSERRMADIIEFLPDPTWVIDTHGRVIAWNRAMEGISGISKKEMIGKGDFAHAVPFYGKPRPVLIDLVLQRHEQWEKEYLTLKEKDGVSD